MLTDLYYHKILSGDQIEKNEMGGERITYGGEKRKLEGKTPLGRPRRRRKNILRWIFRKWDGRAWA